MRGLFLLIILVTSFNSFAQQYEPLLAESNEWHLTACYNGCVTDVYIAHDDTIVDGLSYKILSGYHYLSRTFLLREDIQEKKVYLMKVNPSKNDEYLLYDFSLNVGDSIEMNNPISPFPDNGGWFSLDSIESKIIADGNSYRHFYFSPTVSNTISSLPAIWVESMGSLSLINAAGGNPDINGAGHVSCLFKNGEIHYRNLDSINDCALQYELSILDFESELFSLASTLVEQEIRIELTLSQALLSIYDIGGKLVKQQRISDGLNVISIESIAGIYLLEVKGEKGNRQTAKILVQ